MRKSFYLIILLLLLISAENVFSEKILTAPPITRCSKTNLFVNESAVVEVTIKGYLKDYNIEYPKEPDFSYIDLDRVSLKIDEEIENDNKVHQTYRLKFYFKPAIDSSKIIIEPFNIVFVHKSGEKQEINTSTKKIRLNVQSLYKYQAAKRFRLILIIIGILAGVSLLCGGTIYYIKRKQRLYKEKVESGEIEVNYGEIAFQKYINQKDKYADRNRAELLNVFQTLVKDFIISKLGLNKYDDFLDCDKVDEEIKSEVGKFIKECETIKYSGSAVSDELLDRLENDFKTILFVI